MLETSQSRGPRPGPAQNTNPTIRSNGGLSPFRDNACNKIFKKYFVFSSLNFKVLMIMSLYDSSV